MNDFRKFVNEALPEVERVAMEMADHYQTLRYPINQYFKVITDMFLPNGTHLNRGCTSFHVSEMNKQMENAERCGWVISFDKKEKVFTLEKTYADGKYCIATYTPYDKKAIDIDVTD